MAEEVELKKIELRVSVNCCEGCKRKIKKALRNVEGVLNTEIDPLQPKMTVLGNVNPQIIIKKLLKIGKHAELSSYEELKAEKKEAETVAVTKEKGEQNNGCKQEEQHDSIDKKTEKSKDMTANASNFQDMKKEDQVLAYPDMDSRVHPMMHPYIYGNIKMNPQYCYVAQPQPCAVAVPCYAMPLYPAPPLSPICVEEYYHSDKSSYHCQPPLLRPTEPIGDYFSDENAVGCLVM